MESVMTDSVVKISRGSARIYWGGTPLGGKFQTPGAKCRWWRHDWVLDEYPGVRGTYRDKVCRKCPRRKPLS
ncbi:hypothetical protein [Mycobacterium phage WXIN]|nr:hypothetical protein [Mycobacterium phage WXIN]